MSNRTDWPELAAEILDRSGYVDDPEVAKRQLRERFEAELHNAFVAGQEHEVTRQKLGVSLAAPIKDYLKQPACKGTGVHRYSQLRDGAPCDFCGEPAEGRRKEP